MRVDRPRQLLRLARQHRWTVVAAVTSLVLLSLYVSPLWNDLHTWGGTFDWGYFFFLAEVDRKTLVEFLQFPLWNPYYCGGSVHLANPQSFTLSPFNVFVLVFGTPMGIRLMLTATTLMAADGVRRWSLAIGIEPPCAWLAGTFYAASGAMAQHLGGGHIGWMAFALTPYCLWAFHRALDGDRRFIAVGAFALAWTFVHFGVYPYPYTALAVGAYGLCVGFAQRRVRSAVTIGLAMAALSLGLAGLRLVPLIEFILEHPRSVRDQDALQFRELWEIYAVRHSARRFGRHPWVWPEYGNYVGVLGVVTVGAGMVVALARRTSRRWAWPAVAGVVFFVACQMGNHPALPWTYIRKLPVYENLRVPSRFTTLVGLFAAPLFGWAATALVALVRAHRGALRVLAVAGMMLLVMSLANQIDFNREQWRQTFGRSPPAGRPAPHFRQMRGNRARMFAYPRMNQGSLDCFEESPLPKSKRLSGTRAVEEWLLDPERGSAKRFSWTPNRIEVHVRLTEASTLLINQNFAAGWNSSAGQVVSHEGLLAVALSAGDHRVVLSYWPRSFSFGLAVSIAALLVSAWLMFRGRSSGPPRVHVRRANASKEVPSGT